MTTSAAIGTRSNVRIVRDRGISLPRSIPFDGLGARAAPRLGVGGFADQNERRSQRDTDREVSHGALLRSVVRSASRICRTRGDVKPADRHPGYARDTARRLTNIGGATAIQVQQHIAIFFETDGAVIVDPDGAGPLFEAPIAGPLPEGLSF